MVTGAAGFGRTAAPTAAAALAPPPAANVRPPSSRWRTPLPAQAPRGRTASAERWPAPLCAPGTGCWEWTSCGCRRTRQMRVRHQRAAGAEPPVVAPDDPLSPPACRVASRPCVCAPPPAVQASRWAPPTLTWCWTLRRPRRWGLCRERWRNTSVSGAAAGCAWLRWPPGCCFLVVGLLARPLSLPTPGGFCRSAAPLATCAQPARLPARPPAAARRAPS